MLQIPKGTGLHNQTIRKFQKRNSRSIRISEVIDALLTRMTDDMLRLAYFFVNFADEW